ncbi:hypothetical protein [Chondrinema litorale]|uniref:hypothetical protein n=1 Tax=Chondrinema litorale TaxID=2994555 RepID=UPI002543549B|nr:hypothetical protein [Chondrinema litorale]UZR95447.1 hypothetical protein OQ292_06420 [Chondrinema litorale]
MKIRSITDLTPLIDVFLILVFVLLIGAQEGKKITEAQISDLQQKIDSLQQISDLQLELNQAFKDDLSASEDSILKYRQELKIQQNTLQSTIVSISEKLSQLFNETDLTLQQKVFDNELSAEDYKTFTEKLENLQLTQQEGLIEKIYVLSELESIASVISVYLDSGNVIRIDGITRPIQLNEFDSETGDFSDVARNDFSENLQTTLLDHYENLRRSNQKPGEIVLITFGYSEQAMRGAIRITEKVSRNFYNELIVREAGGKKVFFAPLGFYPLSNE